MRWDRLSRLSAASAEATEDRGEAGAEDEGDDPRQPDPEPGLKHYYIKITIEVEKLDDKTKDSL